MDTFSQFQTHLRDGLRPGDTYESQEHDTIILENLWCAGHLQRHLDALERFYLSHFDKIQTLLERGQGGASLVEAAKQLVIEKRIVDRINETLDQIEAMEFEVCAQERQGNFDRERIVEAWAENYAAKWREWRIKEYLYATEQMKDRLENCLRRAS